MRSLTLIAQVNERHELIASLPADFPEGPVEIVVMRLGDDEDEAGATWSAGIAQEWSTELSDSREDVYTLDDGEAIDGRR